MAVTEIREERGAGQYGWQRVEALMQNTQVPRHETLPDVLQLIDRLRSRSERSPRWFETDQGTRVGSRSDIRSLLASTMFAPPVIVFEPEPTRLIPMTRMARIRELADLSLREWAPVFGVTHTTIKQWLSLEPDRNKVGQVLEALEEAARYHGDLAKWLRRPLPGTDLAPLQLLARDSWRAFRGALRSRPAPPVAISADELGRRRRADEAWAIPETPAVSTE
jgi:hypothetical protein